MEILGTSEVLLLATACTALIFLVQSCVLGKQQARSGHTIKQHATSVLSGSNKTFWLVGISWPGKSNKTPYWEHGNQPLTDDSGNWLFNMVW